MKEIVLGSAEAFKEEQSRHSSGKSCSSSLMF